MSINKDTQSTKVNAKYYNVYEKTYRLHLVAFKTFLLLYAIAFNSTPANAETSIPLNIGGQLITKKLKSFVDFRDRGVVKQDFDYSCGAAALATLLTYGMDDAISEKEVLEEILTELAKDKKSLVEKKGLSLLDMKNFAAKRGYKAQGFRLSAKYLNKINRPVIVFVKPRNYEHFAVLKGIRGDRAYLADPTRGNVRMPLYRFLHEWLNDDDKGIVFLIEKADGIWPKDYLLSLPETAHTNPELLTVKSLMNIGGI